METENGKTHMSRGYRSRSTTAEVRAVLNDVNAWQELSGELLEKIRRLPSEAVTRTEVVRDFGASSSGLKLFEQAGWLVAAGPRRKRKTYQVHDVICASVLLPGLFHAPQTRIVRKRKDSRNGSKNIVTVVKETVDRILHLNELHSNGGDDPNVPKNGQLLTSNRCNHQLRIATRSPHEAVKRQINK